MGFGWLRIPDGGDPGEERLSDDPNPIGRLLFFVFFLENVPYVRNLVGTWIVNICGEGLSGDPAVFYLTDGP